MHTLNDISEIKTDLVEELKHELRCKGYENLNTWEVGQVVDMIKDLAKTEKDCMEKCYYEAVVDAMYEHGFENEGEIEEYGRMGYGPNGMYSGSSRGGNRGSRSNGGRMGYDTRRYSNGRYAPKGAGHYSPVHGYTPHYDHMPMMDNHYSMGYPGEAEMHKDYGQAYRDYKRSMHFYHETGDENERLKKDHHAEKHVHETVETIKDIWGEASPDLKKKIKGDMSKLLAEMTI